MSGTLLCDHSYCLMLQNVLLISNLIFWNISLISCMYTYQSQIMGNWSYELGLFCFHPFYKKLLKILVFLFVIESFSCWNFDQVFSVPLRWRIERNKLRNITQTEVLLWEVCEKLVRSENYSIRELPWCLIAQCLVESLLGVNSILAVNCAKFSFFSFWLFLE